MLLLFCSGLPYAMISVPTGSSTTETLHEPKLEHTFPLNEKWPRVRDSSLARPLSLSLSLSLSFLHAHESGASAELQYWPPGQSVIRQEENSARQHNTAAEIFRASYETMTLPTDCSVGMV